MMLPLHLDMGHAIMRILLACIIICLNISSALATTYYVSTSGSDGAAGSIGAPWRTVTHAISVMVAGDTTLIENGTYTENPLGFNTNGSSGAPITLQAQNPCTGSGTSVSCSAIIQINTNCIPGIGISASYITLRGFQLNGSGTTCGSGYSSRNDGIRGWGVDRPDHNPTTPSVNCPTSAPSPSGYGPWPGCNTPSSTWTNDVVDNLYIPENNANDIAIKLNADFGEIKNSTIYGPVEAAFDNNSATVHNNVIYSGSASTGNRAIGDDELIETKGGSRNIQIYDNLIISNRDAYQILSLGGGSQQYTNSGSPSYNIETPPVPGHQPCCWWDEDAHIECYNCIAYNNIIVDTSADSVGQVAQLRGTYNSGYYNNVFIGWIMINLYPGCENGCQAPNNATAGSGNAPYPTNPSYVNNIWYGNGNVWTKGFFNGYDTGSTTACSGQCTGTKTFDHNTMYNFAVVSGNGSNPYPNGATNVTTSNPNFVNPASNWHLQSGSPAIAAAIAQTPAMNGGGTFNISLDYAGTSRGSSSPWDQGVYVFGSGGVTATLLVNGSSSATISPGGTATLTWSSSGATSCTGTNFSTGGATSDGSPVSVSPTMTTTYSITCTDGTSNGSSSVVVTVTGGGSGNKWYVDNSVGSNGSGTSWGSAWSDVNNIVWGGSGVNPGDTIYISGGTTSQTYTNQIVPTAGGSSGNPITITAGIDTGHTGQVIIDGGTGPGVFPIDIACGSCNDFIIQNLTVQNIGDAGVFINGTTADTTIVQNLLIHTGPGPTGGSAFGMQITNNVGVVNVLNNTIDTPASTTSGASTVGLSVQGNSGLLTISGNVLLENNASTGQTIGVGNHCINSYKNGNMTISGNFCSHVNGGAGNLGFNIDSMVAGTNALIYNNVVYMPLGDAIANNFSMSTGGFTGTMSYYNNTTYGNGSSYLMTITAAGATLENNIFYQVGSGTGVYTTAALTSDYNLIYAPSGVVAVISGTNETWANWQAAGHDAHGVNANPLFTTIANAAGGFALQATSPALNVGTTLSQVPTDYLGVTRPQGTAYDMGAFERVPSGGGVVSKLILLLGAGR